MRSFVCGAKNLLITSQWTSLGSYKKYDLVGYLVGTEKP